MRRRPIRQERAWQNNQSLHQLDLAQPPLLREERFARAIETKDREPALAGRGLDPVAILQRRQVTRLPRRAVDGSGKPALVVDCAIAEHFEILRLVLLRSLRIVEGI